MESGWYWVKWLGDSDEWSAEYYDAIHDWWRFGALLEDKPIIIGPRIEEPEKGEK